MKKHNFNAGPCVLPREAVESAIEAIRDFDNTGIGLLEISHRTPGWERIMAETEQLWRDLLNIPDDYAVMFLGGGASTQFFEVPANLLKKKAAYLQTGVWAKKAAKEAKFYGEVEIVASSEDKTFSYIPDCSDLPISPDADYVYICENNTIYGTKWNTLPETGNVPLVADISSCILSEPIDVSRFGLLYAGAQKNMGPAGLTVVIIREDLIGHAKDFTPTMFNYQTHADNDSMFNTPPCYAIYICKLVLDWIKNDIGGLEKMKELNEKKAKILYDFLDSSKLFKGTVVPEDRSLMNIPFVTGSEELDAKFVKEAAAHDFVNIKGHRSVGGMRASVYNAMPIEGVEKLVAFMKEFEAANL